MRAWNGSRRKKFEVAWNANHDNVAERLSLGNALLAKHRPKRSVSSGNDCGDLRRAGVAELSWLDQMAINWGRLYMHVCKISGATGGRGAQHTLRGHAITFPQPLAAQCTAAIAAQVRLPRTDVHERISIVFVGPQNQREKWAKLTLPFGDMAVAHYDMIIRALKVLKAVECPFLPDDLVIDESVETRQYYEGGKDSATSLLGQLHAGVTIESSEIVCDSDFLGNNGDSAAALPQAGAFRGEGEPDIAPDAIVLMEHSFYGQDGSMSGNDAAPGIAAPRDTAAAADAARKREHLCGIRDLLSSHRHKHEMTVPWRLPTVCAPMYAYSIST